MDQKEKEIFKSGRKDEVLLNHPAFCPGHRIPHKLPFKEKIYNERCHFHKKPLNMCHHIPFCYLMNCENFKRMMEKYKEYRKEEKKSEKANLKK